MGQSPSTKQLAQWINQVMGQNVMSPSKLDHILKNAKQAHDKGGINGMLDYLQHVTQAPVSKRELRQFGRSVKESGNAKQAMKSLKRQK